MMSDTWNSVMIASAGSPEGGWNSRPAGWPTHRSHDGSSRQPFSATRISHRTPPAHVYALAGVLTDCKPAYEFLQRLTADVESNDVAVVIDLSEVTQMTSCGVGILAAAYNATLDEGRRMGLVGMSTRLVSVMRTVGLLPVIPSYETRQDALNALAE